MTAADKTASMTVKQAREELTRLEKRAQPHLMAGEARAIQLRRRGFFDDRLGFSEEFSIEFGARRTYETFQISSKVVDTRGGVTIRLEIDLRARSGVLAARRREAMSVLRTAAEKGERESNQTHAAALLPEARR